MKVTTVNVSLPEELVRFVRGKVESGYYSSVSEVVRDGLRLLARSEQNGADEEEPFDRDQVQRAIAGLKRLGATQTLGPDLTLRELIDEGRA